MNSQEQSNLKIMNKEIKTTSQSPGCKRVASETSDRGNGVNNSRELCMKKLSNYGWNGHSSENGLRNSAMSVEPEFIAETHVIDEHNEKNRALEVSCVPACMKTRGNAVERPVGNTCLGLGSTYGSQPWLMKSRSCKGSDSDFYDFVNDRKAEVFAVGQIWAAYDKECMPGHCAHINRIGHTPFKMHVTWLRSFPVTSHERKWCEVGLPVACGYFDLDISNVAVVGQTMFSHMVYPVQGPKDEKVEIYPQKGEVWALYRDWQPFKWFSEPRTRKGYGLQMVEILTDYSKNMGVMVGCLEKVAGFQSIFQRCVSKGSKSSFQIPAGHLLRFSHYVPIFRFRGEEKDKISDGMFEMDPLAVPGDLVHDMTKPLERGSSSDCSSSTHHPSLSPPIISELENKSLKTKLSWKDFCSDQIWAVYDGPESMPRRYAKVNNVVSGSEVGVTFLEPHPMLDDEIHWVTENLPLVCGLFRADRTIINFGMSQFSHLVNCEHSTQISFYRIFPKKGEIWAMYKDWNAKWKLSDYSCQQCQIVEILSDFSEEAEMKIASLIEVKGFLSFFQRQLHGGFELIRAVPRTEILRFSHEIPSFDVPGIENLVSLKVPCIWNLMHCLPRSPTSSLKASQVDAELAWVIGERPVIILTVAFLLAFSLFFEGPWVTFNASTDMPISSTPLCINTN